MRLFAASATKRSTTQKAESIRHHGRIQPITVRPNSEGFELIAGARRYRAAQLAELFSIPARIVELIYAQSQEWQLIENSQRVDVHPYEEAQGFPTVVHGHGHALGAPLRNEAAYTEELHMRMGLCHSSAQWQYLAPTLSAF